MSEHRSKTLVSCVSDALIKRVKDDLHIVQIRDAKHPVRFRFKANRSRGSWFVVRYVDNKDVWRKVGDYPSLTSKALLKRLADILAVMAVDYNAGQVRVDRWETVGECLQWYVKRATTDNSFSPERKSGVKSAIKCHLMPSLGGCNLEALNHHYLEQRLIWPLQAEYKLSSVRSVFQTLKAAIKRAAILKIIERDYLASIKFTDFIPAKIEPKPAKLTGSDPSILLRGIQVSPITHQCFVLLMLVCATRIGETRKARWCEINFDRAEWFIPALNTKSRKKHKLPLPLSLKRILQGYKQHQINNGYQGAFVFPGRSQEMSSQHANKLIRACSKGEWTAHDLRKFTRDTLKELGVDHWVGERILNHSMGIISETYIDNEYMKLGRKALNKYENMLNPLGLESICLSIENAVGGRDNSFNNCGEPDQITVDINCFNLCDEQKNLDDLAAETIPR